MPTLAEPDETASLALQNQRVIGDNSTVSIAINAGGNPTDIDTKEDGRSTESLRWKIPTFRDTTWSDPAVHRSLHSRTISCRHYFIQCAQFTARMDWFEDRKGEFNLWASGLKADAIGRSSLDHRLRTRPDLHELIYDLLGGLCEALEATLGLSIPGNDAKPDDTSPEESEDDVGSDFSDFSDEASESESDNGAPPNDPLAEHLFSISTILGQLTRISTGIRRSGAKYRYQKADASLEESKFEDLKTHLTAVILMESLRRDAGGEADTEALRVALTDPDRLTPVQKRLIHANIVRQNRVLFATRNSQGVELSADHRVAEQLQSSLWQVEPSGTAVDTDDSFPRASTKASRDETLSKIAPSRRAPSITRTATEVGSQFNVDAVMKTKTTPSVMTKVTRTGAVQDYPSCPKPFSDEFLRCPFCGDILPADYANSPSRWRGHVQQDLLPYCCIYEDCQSPDKMYLTAEELVRHARAEHSITRWVCDNCSSAPTSEPERAFVFDSYGEWERHVHQAHEGVLQPSQMPALGKVSQRQMLDATSCPLCAYTPTQPSSILDSHILQHLHGFALRSLPWSAGEPGKDSVRTRSAQGDGPSSLADEAWDDDLEEFENPEFDDHNYVWMTWSAFHRLYELIYPGQEENQAFVNRLADKIYLRLGDDADTHRETWGAKVVELQRVASKMRDLDPGPTPEDHKNLEGLLNLLADDLSNPIGLSSAFAENQPLSRSPLYREPDMHSGAYQTRVLEVGTAFLPENDGLWTMADCTGDQRLDLVYIKTRNTGTKTIEVHVASASSNYQDLILQIGTDFEVEDNGTWLMGDYNGDGMADLIYIKTRNTGTAKVEIHVASAASNYATRIADQPTVFDPEDDGVWTMADMYRTGRLDLVYIKTTNVGSGTVEVHIASAASGYMEFSLHTGTTFLPETGGTWLVSPYSNRTGQDLVFIKTGPVTGTGKVEVHVAPYVANYSVRGFEGGTAFEPETGGTWLLADYTHNEQPDLVFLKTANTGTGRVEIHIAASSTFGEGWNWHIFLHSAHARQIRAQGIKILPLALESS